MWIQKGSTTKLADKRWLVALQVNLRNPLHTEDAAHMQGIDPGFEIQSKRHQGSKTGVLLAYEKDWCSRIFCFLKSSGTQKKSYI